MTVQDWSTYLDDLEQCIAVQRRQVTEPEPTEVPGVPDVAPPAGLGPLPRCHRERAADVLAQLALLQTELQSACDRTGRALVATRSVLRTVAAPSAGYVDSYS